jgi:hypothetical protein
MPRNHAFLVALLCVLVPWTSAAAQDGKFRTELPLEPIKQPEQSSRSADRRMVEDIEIMRRILERGLKRLIDASRPIGAGGGSGDVSLWDGTVQHHIDVYTNLTDPHRAFYQPQAIEGTYVHGCGVVFNVSLPVRLQHAPQPLEKATREPISQWQRVQKELRGEKLEDEPKASQHKSDVWVDGLLRLLAENGSHFRELADEERVTLALTFRGFEGASFRSSECMACHTAASFHGAGGSAVTSATAGSSTTTISTPRWGASSDPAWQKKSGESAAKEFLTEVQNRSLLGDLHSKEGRFQEAEAAYQLSIDLLARKNTEYLAERQRLGQDTDVSGYLAAVELYFKLAQARQNAGKPREAAEALQAMAEYFHDVGKIAGRQDAQPVRGAARPAIPLPSKLIVSASKKLLDQVGSGRMSFEDFKKSATVQYLQFDGPSGGGSVIGVGDPATGAGKKPEKKP